MDPQQRRALLDVLTRIEEERISIPRISGEVGLFLREWGAARRQCETLLDSADYARGSELGPIHLHLLSPVRETVINDVLGDVASAVAISEELGTIVNVTLWGNARPAGRAKNIWQRDPRASVALAGDYRWFAPRRVTPGTAEVKGGGVLEWDTARALKYVGEEFLTPPRAATYRWDNTVGEPDFRTFRVTPLLYEGGWKILSALDDHLVTLKPLVWSEAAAGQEQICLALLARTAWEPEWTVVATVAATPDTLLAHLVTWADFKRELLGEPPPTSAEVTALSSVLSRHGLRADRDAGVGAATLARYVHTRTRPCAAWLRGLA